MTFLLLGPGWRLAVAEEGHGSSYNSESSDESAADPSSEGGAAESNGDSEGVNVYNQILNQWQADMTNVNAQMKNGQRLVKKVVVKTKKTEITTNNPTPLLKLPSAYQSPVKNSPTRQAANPQAAANVVVNLMNGSTPLSAALPDIKTNEDKSEALKPSMTPSPNKPFSVDVMLWTQGTKLVPVSVQGLPTAKGSGTLISKMANFMRSLWSGRAGDSSQNSEVVDSAPLPANASISQAGMGDLGGLAQVNRAPSSVDDSAWFTWTGWLFSVLLLTLWVRAERKARER